VYAGIAEGQRQVGGLASRAGGSAGIYVPGEGESVQVAWSVVAAAAVVAVANFC
jgi:hypothetical protein